MKKTCPFCRDTSGKITVTPMGSRTVFITCDACGRDQEVVWNKVLETKYGLYRRDKNEEAKQKTEEDRQRLEM